MPPPDTHKPLSAEQRDLLRKWIEQGAPYQRHWSFEPLVTPRFRPPCFRRDYSRREPHRSVHRSRLAREGLTPSPGGRPTHLLIRRLSFDLRGLPPARRSVCLPRRHRPGAYRRLVDRFLASPAYGEEIARHWLDVARYGDTHGLHLDNEALHVALPRLGGGAFNRNLPFDEFTIDQIAGDLLPSPTPDQLTATRIQPLQRDHGRRRRDRRRVPVPLCGGPHRDHGGNLAQSDRRVRRLPRSQVRPALDPRFLLAVRRFFYSAADPAMDEEHTADSAHHPASRRWRTPDASPTSTWKLDPQRIGFAKRWRPSRTPIRPPSPPPPVREMERSGWTMTSPMAPRSRLPGLPVGRNRLRPVFSGRRALHRKDDGISQDSYDSGAAPLEIPQGATLFAHVYVDPGILPKPDAPIQQGRMGSPEPSGGSRRHQMGREGQTQPGADWGSAQGRRMGSTRIPRGTGRPQARRQGLRPCLHPVRRHGELGQVERPRTDRPRP